MAITKAAGRQTPLIANVDFTYADLTSGSAIEAIDLPPGAIVIGGYLNITTAFNSGTTDLLEIGDGADADKFVAGGADNGSTAQTVLFDVAAQWTEYTAKDTVDVTWTAVGTAATAGAATLVVESIIDGRACEVQE